MKTNEGVRRIVITIRVLGVVVLSLGAIALQYAGHGGQLAVGIAMIIIASPFFIVAWIIDGFATSEERELQRVMAEMRRNSEIGRAWRKPGSN